MFELGFEDKTLEHDNHCRHWKIDTNLFFVAPLALGATFAAMLLLICWLWRAPNTRNSADLSLRPSKREICFILCYFENRWKLVCKYAFGYVCRRRFFCTFLFNKINLSILTNNSQIHNKRPWNKNSSNSFLFQFFFVSVSKHNIKGAWNWCGREKKTKATNDWCDMNFGTVSFFEILKKGWHVCYGRPISMRINEVILRIFPLVLASFLTPWTMLTGGIFRKK